MTDSQKLLQQLDALDNLKQEKKDYFKQFREDREQIEASINGLRESLAKADVPPQ